MNEKLRAQINKEREAGLAAVARLQQLCKEAGAEITKTADTLKLSHTIFGEWDETEEEAKEEWKRLMNLVRRLMSA